MTSIISIDLKYQQQVCFATHKISDDPFRLGRSNLHFMTRSEIIDHLSGIHPSLTHTDVTMAVQVILDAMSGTLASGGRIEVRGFGSFVLNYRPPRKGRNPKTGDAVSIPAKYVPHFRTGKGLRERVDQ